MKIEYTDFDHYDEPRKTYCEELQSKMIELQNRSFPVKLEGDALWEAAAKALGNDDGRYCGIYQCDHCGRLYHTDYTNAMFEDGGDFCGIDCEEENESRENEKL